MVSSVTEPFFAGMASQQQPHWSEEEGKTWTGHAKWWVPFEGSTAIQKWHGVLEASSLRSPRLPHLNAGRPVVLQPKEEEGRPEETAAQQEICAVWRPLGEDWPHLQVRNTTTLFVRPLVYSVIHDMDTTCVNGMRGGGRGELIAAYIRLFTFELGKLSACGGTCL